jgi:hypothetical protein
LSLSLSVIINVSIKNHSGHIGIHLKSRHPILFSGICSLCIQPACQPQKPHSIPLQGSYLTLCLNQNLQVKNAKLPTPLAFFIQRCRDQNAIPAFSTTLCMHSLTSGLLWVIGDQFSLSIDTSTSSSSYSMCPCTVPWQVQLARCSM